MVIIALGFPHFTPHCLRHTYASLLLARGTPPQFVRDQLGHSSIGTTVDLYGSFRSRRLADVDALDDD